LDDAATYSTQTPESFMEPDYLMSFTSSKWSIIKWHVALPFLISIIRSNQPPLALISTPFSIVHFPVPNLQLLMH
jgi:hypothetical protein